MQLGYVSLKGRGATDHFLAGVAKSLQVQGLALVGTVQTNPLRAGRAQCDMDLQVLPDGPVVRISEDRGAGAAGCRLNAGALEQTVLAVSARLDGADLLLINKFGKQEAAGRGLVPVMAEALSRGLPVLVGVNTLNLPAFETFASGLGQALPADPAQVVAWCLQGRQRNRQQAFTGF